jgi:hypothetical protein
MRWHGRLILGLAIILVAAIPSSAAAPARQEPPPSRIVAEAHRILANLHSSEYSHKTHIDESAGSYAVDCSGLVCAVLKKAAPAQLAAVPKAKGQARQRAAEFYDAFALAPTKAPTTASTRPWRRIARLANAAPGDLIAWRRPIIEAGQDTGHIVIVDQAPIAEGNGIFRVTVIDSVTAPHSDDTRKPPATGLGRGTMYFKVDRQGRPIAYSWKSRTGPFHEISIAIGRAVVVRR